MKKLSIIFLAIILFSAFCGCANNSSSPEQKLNAAEIKANISSKYYNYKTDCQFGKTNSPTPQFATKGEDGYYIVTDNGYLLYTDITSGTVTPLCNKPNCMHDTNKCYAFISSSDNIAYNNGYIYYDYLASDDNSNEYGTSVRRIAADGSGSSETVYNCDHNIYDWIVHRGNLYIAVCEFDPNHKNSEFGRSKLTQIPIDDPKNASLLYDSQEYLPFASFSYLAAFDRYVYFDTDYQNKKEDIVETLYSYDIKTKKLNEILLPNGKSCNASYIYPLADKLIFKYKTDIYQCGLNGKNVKKVMTLDSKYRQIFTDGTYLYEDNTTFFSASDYLNIKKEDSRVLKVYDENFKLVDTLDLGDFNYSLCPCDDKYFIFSDEDEDNFYYLDKAQIGGLNGSEWEKTALEKID